MKRAALTCIALAFFAGSVFSQTVNMCGTVTDAGGKPLVNAVVRLGQATYDNGYYAQAPYLVSTDADGHYQLGTGTCNVNVIPRSTLAGGDAFSRPQYVGGKVLFSVPQTTASVRMSIYTLAGRFVRDVMNSGLVKGNYSVSIDTRGISSQYYLLRVTIDGAATVMRIQPAFHSTDGAIVQNSSGFQTRLEKLAAVVDTLRATMPGYTIGVTPVTALSGQNDFMLTKNSTWNGDTAGFWGSGYPVATGGVTYVILNRTNGVWPDSQIYWALSQGGAKTRLDKQRTVTVSGGGRFYIWIAPNDSNSRYMEWVEEAVGNGSINGNNLTRVDGWRLPIMFRIHFATGKNTDRGDLYEMFFQPRKAKFDEFINEVPKEFTKLATADFANIYAPHMIERTGPTLFNTGGPYVSYFDRYQDSCIAHNTGVPAKTTAWNIFACAGSYGNSATWGGNMNRHVGTLASTQWCDSSNFYQNAPCNYFSKWVHLRSEQGMEYGFPYDDDCNKYSGIVGGVSGVQWFAIAIGW
jgi:Beta-1,3-glucanase